MKYLLILVFMLVCLTRRALSVESAQPTTQPSTYKVFFDCCLEVIHKGDRNVINEFQNKPVKDTLVMLVYFAFNNQGKLKEISTKLIYKCIYPQLTIKLVETAYSELESLCLPLTNVCFII